MGPYSTIRKLKRHGVTATQLEAALGEVNPEEVRAIFDGAVPLRRALAEGASAERTNVRRYYAYLVLAATPATELARRVDAEGYLRRQGAAVSRQVRRSARQGVSEEHLQGAVAAIGARPIAEALAGRTPFGRWARERARTARGRRERIAFAHLAAAGPRRVRDALAVQSEARAARSECREPDDRHGGSGPATPASVAA